MEITNQFPYLRYMKRISITFDREVTDKDIEFVTLIANGDKVTEIAQKLNIDVRAAEYEMAKLKKKFNVRTPVGLVTLSIRNELI